MRYTRFGRTNLNVSRIAFGTWQAGGDWGAPQKEEIKSAIRRALDLGVNFFDTAQAYGFGEAERLLGEALAPELKSRREEVVLATKGGLRMEGDTLLRDASPGWLRKGVEDSLRFLGTDYVDLYQLHWPDPDVPVEESAGALDEMVREGKIRYVGVSNFDEEQMAAFEKVRKLDALQPPYHLFRREIEERILPYCAGHGIGVLVYGPLAHGLLSGRMTKQTRFPEDDWRSKSPMFQGEAFEKNLEKVEELKRFAGERGYTLPQLAVAWTLANPAVDAAIVGARRPDHIEGTAPAAEIDLSEEELREIDEIMRGAVPVGGPAPEGM
ncbi:aldo/keto reductase [Rubrobacter naiadicus]|uniref:aldo/keto reductase n=1 Tax=Rubrobacter naiadicus TaxID=1392641 RepID=UPI0023630908|nr:aldo/keto reductase [Rubrobacter naiadicus]